ncbi:hypothetical protein ACQP1W_29390 [Spirillospora sp. CA-255316]
MARIRLSADVTAEQVMDTVRETFESRDYLWERSGPDTATASEGGKPIGNLSVGISQRLRVGISVDTGKHRLVVRQEMIGAAYINAGGPHVYLRLASRYRKMVKAVREDLAAAALR